MRKLTLIYPFGGGGDLRAGTPSRSATGSSAMRFLAFSSFALAVLGGAAAVAPAASASDIPDTVITELRDMMVSRVALISLEAQNQRLGTIDAAEIEAMDQQWRAEAESDNQPLIAQLMGNPLSSYLIRKKAESNGLFAEMFVFDAKGMNVGQSSVTSDYWQGDEDKYLETFAKGPAAVFVDEIEFNDETRQRRRQVSFTIVDPESGEAIGGATVEINVDEMERRS